jgi:hypothetical protein
MPHDSVRHYRSFSASIPLAPQAPSSRKFLLRRPPGCRASRPLLIGERTAGIQKMIIGRRIVRDYAI